MVLEECTEAEALTAGLQDVRLGELVEVGRVVDALDLDGDRCRSLSENERRIMVRSEPPRSIKHTRHTVRPDVIVIDALEEAVPLDLVDAGGSDAMLGLTAEAQDQSLRSLRDRHLWRKHQRLLPAHHLLIGLLRSF